MSKLSVCFVIFVSFMSLSTFASSNFFVDFDETKIQAPKKDSNEEILYGTSCRTRDHLRWDVCFGVNPKDELLIRSFKFANPGGNKTVPMSGFGVGREYEFSFEGLARSDMNLLVWDSPDETESHVHLKILYFFPREILPAIRYDEGNSALIVTLPTREEVVFDAKTGEVMSGALVEGPLKQTSSGAAIAPDVQYNGRGVVIEASANASWPVGLDETNAAKTVAVKKKGHRICNIPNKELFYTDANKGGNTFMNKKYVTDKAFDQFIKARCGFSIY